MAYKKADMIKQCLKAIKENELIWIEEIVAYMPFTKPTFYKHKLNEVNEIKSALENNKIQTKSKMRQNWSRWDSSPTLQIALYRMLASEREYERLTIERIDHTSKGDKIQPIEFTVASKETIEITKKLINESMLN